MLFNSFRFIFLFLPLTQTDYSLSSYLFHALTGQFWFVLDYFLAQFIERMPITAQRMPAAITRSI
jgi:hypothetical protein